MRFSFLLCCAFALWAKIAEGAATPTVQSVDFYPSGAKFVFQIDADKDFEFALPGAFDPQSVRFLVQDSVTSLRVESAPREEWTPPSLSSLKAQIDVKDRDFKLLQGRQSSLQQTLAMMAAPLPKSFNDKDLILYIEDAQALRLRVETELVDLLLLIEKNQKELDVLQAEYQRKMPHNAQNVVLVRGTATEAGKQLAFEALTHSAGWSVQYGMDLNSATGVVSAKMYARVWQQTGVDVAGDFAFHTRQPSQAINPPDVSPLVVDLLSKHRQSMRFEGRSAAGDMMAMSKANVTAPVPETMMSDAAFVAPSAPPAMASTLADVSVKGSGDLKGDGMPEDVALGRFELKSIPVLVSIPEQSREAWIVASLDAVPETLLPGAAELTVDGAASGRAYIPEHGTEQTVLPFGMASRLTAKKQPLLGKTGSSWTGKGSVEDGYSLEITNGMETEREVTVLDRIPAPADEKIVLEVKKIDPAPTERDKDNKLTWKISVKPGETEKIVVEYTLRYPGDDALIYR